jgi:hypothetical protein
MLNKIQYIILLGILVIGCSENSTDPYKNLTPLKLEEAVHQVTMNIVDYDSILIESKDGFVLDNKSVDTIFVTSKVEESDFNYGNDFIIPNYDGITGKYQLNFRKKIGVPKGRIVDIKLSYHNNVGNPITNDSTFYMYKYPYSGTTIFFNLEENLTSNENTIQGFEIVENNLYFCPSGGGAGIWRYNFTTMEEEDLYGTGSGDHITANETFAFYDADHRKILRYNLDIGIMDLELDLSSLGSLHSIAGLDIYESYLFALIQKNAGDDLTLIKFDFMGNVIEEIPVMKSSYYFTILGSIAYFKSYTENELLRFNLITHEFLESLVLPSHFGAMEGFRIYDDKFYYVNFLGPYIYVLDFDELEPILVTVDYE